jgi:hypothetical protein
MSIGYESCPGCWRSGHSHLESCPEAAHNKYRELTQPSSSTRNHAKPEPSPAQPAARDVAIKVLAEIKAEQCGLNQVDILESALNDWHSFRLQQDAEKKAEKIYRAEYGYRREPGHMEVKVKEFTAILKGEE